MNMSTNNENYELDYYLSIIEYFQNKDTNRETTEIWKNKSFIQLMKVLKRTRNKEFVKNAIILILSLFDKMPPDFYSSRGIQVNSLTNSEKLTYVNLLKSEIANDIPN